MMLHDPLVLHDPLEILEHLDGNIVQGSYAHPHVDTLCLQAGIPRYPKEGLRMQVVLSTSCFILSGDQIMLPSIAQRLQPLFLVEVVDFGLQRLLQVVLQVESMVKSLHGQPMKIIRASSQGTRVQFQNEETNLAHLAVQVVYRTNQN